MTVKIHHEVPQSSLFVDDTSFCNGNSSYESKKTNRNPYLRYLDTFTRERLETSRYNLISLFCGGGGLDLGLGFAGFQSIVVSDLAPIFVETVSSNLPHAKPLAEDALNLTADILLSEAETSAIDLVAAGPPCQAFSILGKRGALDDPRGKLALKYFELISEIKPRAFLFENVPGLLTVNRGDDWKRLMDYAQEVTGYHLHWKKLNAASFGIPQYRERVVVIGFRENLPFEYPNVPTGLYASDLMEKAPNGSPSAWALEDIDGLPNHEARIHGARVHQRYCNTPQGGRDKTDHTDRIHPEKPSGTVLVGSSAGGGRPHIHPFHPRVITVREGARLQSFPDWYEIHGTGTAQYRQIGNAVPVLLAYEVGKRIAEALEGAKINVS